MVNVTRVLVVAALALPVDQASAQAVAAPSPIPVLGLAALALAGPAASITPQAAESTLVKGRWMIAFVLPSGGGSTISLGRMVSSRLKVQLDFSGSLQTNSSASADTSGFAIAQNGNTRQLQVGPSIRWYVRRDQPVAPFLMAAASVGLSRSSNTQSNSSPATGADTAWSHSFSGRVAVGAEWFPITSLSVGGWVGAEWVYQSNTSASGASAGAGNVYTLHTVVSGLSLQFYF